MASTPAPDELELVRRYVNTLDIDEQTDELDDPGALARWLAENGLGEHHTTGRDLEQAIELREALRAILLHHGGEELDPEAPLVLDAAALRARLAVRFEADLTTRVEARAAGVDGALGSLLAIIARAVAAGTWPRLKVCLADTCQWAYYDLSRNRSSVWCDMKVCGNRQKVRSFRERRLSGHEH